MLVLTLLISCKKPEPYITEVNQIFKPLPYWPVYPGSHWIYVDYSSNNVTYTTKPNYEQVNFRYTDSIVLDPILLPNYDGNYFMGYSKLVTYGNYPDNLYDRFEPFFSEEIGKKFINAQSGYYQKYYYNSTETYTVKDFLDTIHHTYLGIIDSVIIMDKVIDFTTQGHKFPEHYNLYYAKNIGLVRSVFINDSTNVKSLVLDLKDYTINR